MQSDKKEIAAMAPQSTSHSSNVESWLIRLRERKALIVIAKNTGWLLTDRIVRLVLGFIVGAWVARYLGPAQFGHLSYVISFIAFFQAIATLGADTIIVRDITHQPATAHQILGSAFRLRLSVGILCWFLAVAFAAIMNPGEHETIALTAIVGGALAFQAADTIDLWFQSQSQSKRTVQAKLVAYFLTNGLKIFLILAKAPLIIFALAFVLDVAISSASLLLAYRRYPTANKWQTDLHAAKQLIKLSWPFMLSAISVMVYMRIDQIMLKEMRGEHELGIYAAALPISQLWQTIPMTLAISLAPVVARKKLESQAAYESVLLHVFRLFGICALVVSCATALLARSIIPILYGPSFAETAHVLSIHVFSNVFLSLGVAQSLWITNEQAGGIALIKTFCGGLTAIAGNIIAIPIWGASGAAVVAILAQAMAAVITNAVLAPRILIMQLGFKPYGEEVRV